MAMNSHFIILCLTLFSLSLISSITATNPEVSHILNHQHRKNHSKSKPEIGVYELKKGNISIKVTNYGATIMSVILPDKNGKLADVVLGYDSPKDYMNDTTYFGALVGRVANRIGGAKYTYEGVTYKLVPNEGKNILHGGPKGFSTVIWEVDQFYPKAPSPYIRFSYFSKDGEEGFPGNLKVKVAYKIVEGNHLSVSMTAKALDKATPVNLAQHTYWNLGGHNSGNILANDVQIFGSQITPVDDELIPTGKFEKVQRTPYDFLKSHAVGSKINELPKGYDINYVLDISKKTGPLNRVAIVKDKKSGRVMELWANKPGVQFYTSNLLKHEKGKGGAVYGPHAALALETQGFPDAVNHPNFPSVMVSPCEHYKHHMLYKFSTTS
ncbi:aldose 1-epimerase-like [Chenopodium quinoa]|nr:aldose 1-epimerase-like [Chenopodium quinoa]